MSSVHPLSHCVALVRKGLRTGRSAIGSGYRIHDRFVLTARHVVDPDDASADDAVVRFGASTATHPVSWEACGGDVALLELSTAEESPARETPTLPLARLAEGSLPVPCQVWGFPKMFASEDVREDFAFQGNLIRAGFSSRRTGSLMMQVTMVSSGLAARGENPFGGLSGAGIFVAGCLVGIVTETRSYGDQVFLVGDPVASVPAHLRTKHVACDPHDLVESHLAASVAARRHEPRDTLARAVSDEIRMRYGVVVEVDLVDVLGVHWSV